MSKTEYTAHLPNYTIGTDCYAAIGTVTRHFGRKVVIIGGKTALAKSRDAIIKGMEGTSLELLDTLWYGDDATMDNAEALIANPAVQAADIIFGVGGGRAIDTGKVVADKANKAYFTFPTVASNCAPCTGIAVIYKNDGSLWGYYLPQEPPIHTFINTAIIADSPFELFWAGIGDAFSKECECEYASRNEDLFHTTLLGRQVSMCCTKPLLDNGLKALNDFKRKEASFELQQVVLDIIISTGIVSNLTVGGDEYYYNSSLAHCFYNASTVLPQLHKHLHGEIVAFGVLVLLTYDQQFDLRDKVAAFYKAAKLPTTLADLDITKSTDIDAIVAKAPSIKEWNCVAEPVTQEKFKQAILDANEFGKSL